MTRVLLRLRASTAVATVATVAAFGMTACGSSDNDSSSTAASGGSGSQSASGSAVAQAAGAKVKGNLKADKIGPTQPVGKPIPKGKNLIYVNCGQPACTNQGKAFKAAAAVLGWKTTEIQALPTPQAVQAAFDEVIRRKPDAVASAGFGRSLYPKQIDQLNKMKIPVLSTTGTEETGQGGIAFEPLPPKKAGEATALLADQTISDLDGKGEVGSILLGGYPIVASYTKAYEDEIKASCPDCSVKQLEIQPTSIGKDAPQKIANFLRANPKIKALFLSYDALGGGLPAAVKGAGVTLPKTYSWAPDAPGIQALNSGERTASVIMPYPELGWSLIDAYARIVTGGDVAGAQPLQPLLIVGKELNNVPATGDPFPASVADYQAQYKALWGVK